MNVVTLTGSLRADSFSKALAAEIASEIATVAPGASVTPFARLAELPHYDQDLDTDAPVEPVAALREAVASADALVVVTPEYNGSLPGVLKNALDWASRPRGASSLDRKPAIVVGNSPLAWGGKNAAAHAAKVLGVAGASVVGEPVLVGEVHEWLASSGESDERTLALRSLVGELTNSLVPA